MAQTSILSAQGLHDSRRIWGESILYGLLDPKIRDCADQSESRWVRFREGRGAAVRGSSLKHRSQWREVEGHLESTVG